MHGQFGKLKLFLFRPSTTLNNLAQTFPCLRDMDSSSQLSCTEGVLGRNTEIDLQIWCHQHLNTPRIHYNTYFYQATSISAHWFFSFLGGHTDRWTKTLAHKQTPVKTIPAYNHVHTSSKWFEFYSHSNYSSEFSLGNRSMLSLLRPTLSRTTRRRSQCTLKSLDTFVAVHHLSLYMHKLVVY